jgi:hypothetical protein
MTMTEYLIENWLVIIFIGIFSLGIVILFFTKTKKLNKQDLRTAMANIENTIKYDSSFAVLESHKIFIKTLEKIYPNNNRRTAAETIKLAEHSFKNQSQIWRIHRLRNRIAHEPNTRVSQTERDLARRDLISALRCLT